MHVQDLKEIAEKLSIPNNGTKLKLIARIIYFVQTGAVIKEPKVPVASCAQKGVQYPLAPNTVMLKGAYKNDLKTRLFFKNLIGEHFHFTAFGIDWLNDCWMAGDPPSYGAFAKITCAGYDLYVWLSPILLV